MAEIYPLEGEALAEYSRWLAGRPPAVQDMVVKRPPDRLYRIPTGHRVVVIAYAEGGTVRVAVTGRWNFVTVDHQVFGVPLEDLVECDLPGPGETLGTMVTDPAEAERFLQSWVAEQEKQGEGGGVDPEEVRRFMTPWVNEYARRRRKGRTP